MIPKIIHYCWFGGKPLPELAVKCIESWKTFCPDFEIRRWDESNYDVNKIQYMSEAYKCKRYAFVSDYARLDVVYQYGGIYLDTDVELIKPINDLLGLEGFCGVERGSGCVSTGMGFGACKENATIGLLRDAYHTRVFLRDGIPDLTAEPVLNTQILTNSGYVDSPEVSRFGCLTVFPWMYFCPVDFSCGEITVCQETYSIHHYNRSWYTERERYASRLKVSLSRFLPGKLSGQAAFFVAQCKYDGVWKAIKRTWNKLTKR